MMIGAGKIQKPFGKLLKREVVNGRAAVDSDIQVLEQLYKDYTGENMNGLISYSREKVNASMRQLFNQGALIIAEAREEGKEPRTIGFMAGYETDCMFSDEQLYMIMFFYIAPSDRHLAPAFLGIIEQMLATKTKATKYIIASPKFDKSDVYDRWYRMGGAKDLETHFIKDVKR